jgi:hypothetical protein
MSTTTFLAEQVSLKVASRPIADSTDNQSVSLVLNTLFEGYAGSFQIVLWDGQVIPWGSNPQFSLIFREKNALKRLVLQANIFSAGKDFIENKIDIQGDLFQAIDLGNFIAKQNFSWSEKANLLVALLKI